MLGPLPPLYRVIVSVCALLSFAGLGAWLGYLLPESLLAETGAGIGLGLGLGLMAVLMLNHDSSHGPDHRTPLRGRATRH